MREALKARMPADSAAEGAKAIQAFRAKVDSVGGSAGGGGFGFGGRRAPPNFSQLNARFVGQLTAQDNADQAPTEATRAGFVSVCHELKTAMATWAELNRNELATLNTVLSKSGLRPVEPAPALHGLDCGDAAVPKR